MPVTNAMTWLSRMSTGCSRTSPPTIPGDGPTKTPTHYRLPRAHDARSTSAERRFSSGEGRAVRLDALRAVLDDPGQAVRDSLNACLGLLRLRAKPVQQHVANHLLGRLLAR